jgi:hypothetical protein
MMKFSSRMDVFLEPSAAIQVKAGDHVKGGSSVLARLDLDSRQSANNRNSGSQGAH